MEWVAPDTWDGSRKSWAFLLGTTLGSPFTLHASAKLKGLIQGRGVTQVSFRGSKASMSCLTQDVS